ncbi:MAG TPA: RluA family pseudouridine synthase [Hyphomonas sp.]|nr:RluA family pseudouridine synthase [Hyphomonas sp.]
MSGQVVTETVTAKEDGTRLDRWIKRRVQLTQGQVEKMIRTGQIRVDGARAKSNTRLTTGMQVRLPILSADATKPAPDKVAKISREDREFLRGITLYEDDDMIALNKPAGIAVQGGSGQGRHIDGMLAALGDGTHRPVLVHRLDKDTSGVLLVAKHPAAAARLAELFRGRDMEKVYWAVTVGVPNPPFGQIRCWMVKGVPDESYEGGYRPVDPREGARRRDTDRERMIRSAHGVEGAKHAVTDYAVISTAGQRAAWVALKPQTGRMHQLRFHMLEMNTSILGDFKYQSRREVPQGLAPGMHLHARALVIPRKTGKPLTIVAPLPPHMKETFETLGFLEQEAGKDPLAPFV